MAQATAVPASAHRERIQLVVDQAVVVSEADPGVVRLALIEPDAAYVDTHLERVTAAVDAQVVDITPGRANLDIRAVVVQGFEVVRADRIVQHTGLRIVKR